ncbi:hypothetical protein HY251_19750, partial [bacterium]|nr:hypothetical protein [bacterium]
MPIAFACRHCKTGIVIPRGDAGRWGKCPACGGLVQAPLNEPPQAYGASAGPGMTASSDPDTATYTAPTTFDPSSSGDPDAATRLASAPIFDTADPDVAKPPKPEGTVARSSASLARSSSGRVTQSGELAQALSLEVEQARADPARRFGPFVILSELGKGGMGVVYRAWN